MAGNSTISVIYLYIAGMKSYRLYCIKRSPTQGYPRNVSSIVEYSCCNLYFINKITAGEC